MKIADSKSIRSGEQALIMSIMEKLDSETLSSLAVNGLSVEQLDFVNGDMIVLENRIVYKMDFKVTIDMSVIIDRDGNLVCDNCSDSYQDQYDGHEQDEDHDESCNDEGVSQSEDLLPIDDEDAAYIGDDVDNCTDRIEEDMTQIINSSRDFWLGKSRNLKISQDVNV